METIPRSGLANIGSGKVPTATYTLINVHVLLGRPLPFSKTCWGLLLALSVNTSVTLKTLAPPGSNSMVTVQLSPGQVWLPNKVKEGSPLMLVRVITRDAEPVLVNVTVAVGAGE